jgi:hypothetical protein
MPGYTDLSAGGNNDAGDASDRGGLAGSVRPHQAKYLAGGYSE